MKFLTPFHNLISAFKSKLAKNNNEEENIIHQDLQSDELQKKLALLIKDINAVDKKDLKHVEYKKRDKGTKNDLFSSYRIDFHTRDELDHFKKKYKFLLL
jgi:hypothetical protein|tara:strand:- start:1021 stop:1320 length:300 start_codon:yes stop_codon:yes gene_type:complete